VSGVIRQLTAISPPWPSGRSYSAFFCAVFNAAGVNGKSAMAEDPELLRRYAEEKSEVAFRELVRRHTSQPLPRKSSKKAPRRL
jgi:hypothetical protein